MDQVLVATQNPGKVKEFAQLLTDLQVEWLGLADIGITTDIPETGTTFAQNAILKATTYAQMSGLLTLADDSGLEVDALDGQPGVYTARYGGPGLSPAERYQLLLQKLTAVSPPHRTARFRCVLALATPSQLITTSEGTCAGEIATTPVGTGGFGYDPVFYLPHLQQTMAQLSSEAKHQISHRGQAIRAMAPKLRQWWQTNSLEKK